MTSYSPPGWYADPVSPGGVRYWNGASWTAAVARDGVTFDVPIDPSRASVPPAPGIQLDPPPASSTPGYSADGAHPSNRSTLGVVLGVLVAVLVVVLVFAVVSRSDSSDDSPPSTDVPTTEAPAIEAPATEERPDGG